MNIITLLTVNSGVFLLMFSLWKTNTGINQFFKLLLLGCALANLVTLFYQFKP